MRSLLVFDVKLNYTEWLFIGGNGGIMIQSELLTGALLREFQTVSAMISIYCRAHHSDKRRFPKQMPEKQTRGVRQAIDANRLCHSNGLCDECSQLLSYAELRLDRCPYGQQKPTCNQCPIHCYKPEPKQQMQQVMRYAGPRMLLPHPLLAIRHLLHERKSVPDKPPRDQSNRRLRQAQK